MKIVTVSQASEMDRIAIEDFCIPEAILMENAAAAACKVIKDKYTIEDTNFILLCRGGSTPRIVIRLSV
jgi:NAD(P)H-hydrate repair Nnr-like enzyme with NAD(P)H-hydrate epimerase domain